MNTAETLLELDNLRARHTFQTFEAERLRPARWTFNGLAVGLLLVMGRLYGTTPPTGTRCVGFGILTALFLAALYVGVIRVPAAIRHHHRNAARTLTDIRALETDLAEPQRPAVPRIEEP